MTDNPVVDPTMTPAWEALDGRADAFDPDLRAWFAADPNRATRWTIDGADLHVDFSKNLIDEDVLADLLALAEQTGVYDLRDRMFAGEHINVTEDRAVLHTALRRPATDELTVDGQDAIADVHEVLNKVYDFAERVRSGEWTGITGKPVETVVNVGIGGSDLGPVMAYEALKPFVQEGLECRFISNIDPTDAGETTKDLDPETTLVRRRRLRRLKRSRTPRLCATGSSAPCATGASSPTRQPRRTPSPSTSSPCPPLWTRSLSSASTRTMLSASGPGLAAATPWIPLSALRWQSRSARMASLNSLRASTRWMSTSPPRSRKKTCLSSWAC